MKAVVKAKLGVGFEVKEVEIPNIGPNDVLVRVKATGICGTDRHLYRGEAVGALPELPIPFIPGHEFCGDVVEVGEVVDNIKAGDRVSAEVAVSCGKCYYCKTGRQILCENVREIGIDINGSYAEYISVPSQNVHKTPSNLSYEQGALIDCLSSALRPFERVSIGIMDTITILGTGPIGLLQVQIAKILGAKNIIAVGRTPKKLKLAEKLGANKAINAKEENVMKEVLSATDGLGSDVVIEAAGSPITTAQSLHICCKDGQIALMGITTEKTSIESLLVISKALNIFGVWDYTWLTFEKSIDLISSGKVDVNAIISHKLPLEEVMKAFDLIERKEAVKVILIP